MALLDSLIRDAGVPTPISSTDRAFMARKLSAILASAKRITGRDLAAKSWRETHTPTSSGMLWVANPPIRRMLSKQTDYEQATGLVRVGTSADTVIEYEGGYAELPADLYDAILALMGQAWSSRSGTGLAAAPGVTELQLYDVGTVKFADSESVDAVLGVYADIFKSYALAGGHIGVSTLKRAEEV